MRRRFRYSHRATRRENTCGNLPFTFATLTLAFAFIVSPFALTRAADWAARFPRNVVRWAGDAEGGAPFQLRDPQNPRAVIGFEVELVEQLVAILARLTRRPLRAEFVQYEWVTLVPGLDAGDFDLIVSGLEVTPERAQLITLSRPYYIFHQQLVVRRDDTGIMSVSDCLHKPVGTLAGSSADRFLAAAGCQTIIGFDGQVEPYLDLELGRLDAVLLDGPIAMYYAAPNERLKYVGPPVSQGQYAIGLRRNDARLAELVNQALGELLANGQLREILRRWHLWNAEQLALAVGPSANEERRGLGFDAAGQPLPDEQLPPVMPVDRHIIAASAEQWTFDRYGPLLLAAAGTTVGLTVAGMAGAMLLGLLVVLGRLYGPRPLSLAALAYVEFFRGVPMLLVLFGLYFGLSHYGLHLPALATAVLAFSLTYGAYEAEVYRSAIESVPRGQWEAARALGMNESTTFRRIVFPQALRTALGPMTNDFVALFKDTSLVSVIAVRELTKEYLILSRSSLKFVELGLLTAVLYLSMSVPLGYLSRSLERRWGGGRS